MTNKPTPYANKQEFLIALKDKVSIVDTEASAKLPSLCLQDKDGKQYLANKIGVMIQLINSLENKELIVLSKSKSFRKRSLSISWKETVSEEVSEKVTTKKEEITEKPPTKKKTTPKKVTKPKAK